MRVNGFQCDACCKIGNDKEFKGWQFVRDHETNSGYKEQHFCSLHCLRDWVEKQIPVVEEVDNNDYFRLNKEICFSLINCMQKNGWDAEFKIRKDANGKEYEQFQALKDRTMIHIDSEFLRGLDVEGVYKYVEDYIARHVRS